MIKIFKQESGATIVLFAVIIVALLSVVLLAIDFFLLSSSGDKFKRTADRVALASLQEYLNVITTNPSAPKPQIYDDALNHAIQKAGELSDINIEGSIASKYRYGRAVIPTSAVDKFSDNYGTDVDGVLIPGIWHFIEPETGVAACDTRPIGSTEPFKPCFEPNNNSNRANAMMVKMRTRRGTMSHMLSMLNSEFSELNVESIAALIPRRLVIATDVSRSVVRDTHRNYTQGGIEKSEFAFAVQLDTSNASSCSNWSTNLVPNPEQLSYDGLENNRTPNANTLKHFKDDYICKDLNLSYYDTISHSNITKNQAFAIDKETNPQPLNGILDGIHTMLTEFENRGVSGDKVGVLAYDDGLLDQRRLPTPIRDVTGKQTNDTLVTPNTNEPTGEFLKFLKASDTSIPITDPERYNRFLFPRLYSDRSFFGSRRPALTDIKLVLDEAYRMLDETEGFEIADNFVLLITDGLSNCVSNPSLQQIPGLDCYTSNSKTNWPTTESYIVNAFNEITNQTINTKYKRSRINLHVVLIGDTVKPHSLLRKGYSGCINDSEAAQRATQSGETLTNSPTNPNYDPQSGEPYFFPNSWSALANSSGGVWKPIKDCCRDANGNCITATAPGTTINQVENELNQICNAKTGPVGTLVSCPCDSNLASCRNSNPMCNYVDNKARLLCDPKGRSKSEQIQDLVKDIMKDNPYILVQ